MSEGVIRGSLCTAAPFSQTKSGRERDSGEGGGVYRIDNRHTSRAKHRRVDGEKRLIHSLV